MRDLPYFFVFQKNIGHLNLRLFNFAISRYGRQLYVLQNVIFFDSTHMFKNVFYKFPFFHKPYGFDIVFHKSEKPRYLPLVRSTFLLLNSGVLVVSVKKLIN